MVLSLCIARAYSHDRTTAADAASSFHALRDWTLYDMERSSADMSALVDQYLKRNYRNPIADQEVGAGADPIQFNLLKCFDLYHSRQLSAQVKRFVPAPKRTFRQDYPKNR